MEIDTDADSTKICVGCGYVITSKYLHLNGEDWHPPCIRCDECEGHVFTGESTSKFHTQDGKIYCKDCVTQLFQVCAACGDPAKKYVKALGKIWHTFHFKCASCDSILDSYAEVDGKAYCQPCHQRMSAKTFTREKRRSFGTEKRESAAKAAAKPAWAKRTGSTAPKSAIDVMHKSWFVSGLKKSPSGPISASSPSSSPSVSPAPPSPNSPRKDSGNGNGTSPLTSSTGRPYSPSTVGLSHSQNISSPLSPQIPKPDPRSRSKIPPLSYVNPQQNGQHKPAATWQKTTPQAPEPVKPSWLTQTTKQQPAPTAKPVAKPLAPNVLSTFGGKKTDNSNGFVSINFEQHKPSSKVTGGARHTESPTPQHEGMNLGDILDTILRPLSEDEVGSLAFQSIPQLAAIHTQGRLHNNIKHKTIYISSSGVVLLAEQDNEEEGKVGGNSIKFKAPESAVTVASDIYSLGVALWTSADYLLDEEEEPALSAEFCDFIGLMTDDAPENRPPLKSLLPAVERYKDISAPLLSALIREVERKKLLRREIHETTLTKQKNLGKQLLIEVMKGVTLRKVNRDAIAPAIKQTNPHELMCLFIKNFTLTKLRKPAKLPERQVNMNPRDILMKAVLGGTSLKKAYVVAGFDIHSLIIQVPNHPTYGTIFRDISSLFTIPKVSSQIANQICTRYTGEPPDLFVATPTDAGVYFASMVGAFFNRGVIVLQNTGRLPRKMEKFSCGYETLGYVSHAQELQLQKNLIKENTKVVLMDEMLVNGSILEAARIILRETGAKIQEVLCIAELEGFGGRAKIKGFECNVHAMYVFNDNRQEQHR